LVPGASEARLLLDDKSTCDVLPQWSPDHKRIAFTRNTSGGASELRIMDQDGKGDFSVYNKLAGRVAWSPDGTKIAVMSKVGSVNQIFVITLTDPENPLRLTTDGSNKSDPAWCGDQLAFWSDKSGTQQIYTTTLTTKDAPWTPVTKETHDVNDPAWSPDCKKIAYTDQPTKDAKHIWVINADGTTKRQLTSNSTRDMDPNWSHNGNWIAFVRGKTEQPRTWAIRADGTGEEKPLSPAGKEIGHPDWY
jgi:Tol biopolymer transport system component